MFIKYIFKKDNTSRTTEGREAGKIIAEKAAENEQRGKEPEKIYNWGINRIIFAYIVDPYDRSGELSDDALDWVERDTVPCIQSLFHFLIEDKESYERYGYKARMAPVYKEKPDHTDTENAGKVLLKFQFPDEAFYLYMNPQDAEEIQKLAKEYQEEDIAITEL